jgi:cell wall-associated NlpC family hydrolase
MVEILRAVGVLARKFDTTAQGLYDRFPRVQGVVKPGDLVFFGTDTDHITHVGMCVEILENSEVLVLEAAGGRRGMDEPEEAQANGAMVTVRPLRGDYVGAVRPWR